MKEAVFLKLVADVRSDNPATAEDAANKICAVKDKALLPVIHSVLNSDGNVLVRRVMLWTLRNYPKYLSYADYLPWLSDGDLGVREAALVLFMEGGRPAAEVLVRAVRGDDARAQFAAVEALGQFRDSSFVEPLMYAATLPDAEIREIAVMSLGIYEGNAVKAALIAALSDVPPVRFAALSGLKDRVLYPNEAAQISACMSDADAEIRQAAVYVLDAHVPDLVCSDESPLVRRAFASVTTSASALQTLCTDEDSSVRTAAADSIGKQKLGLEEVLIPMLKDEVPGVRRAAATSLDGSTKPEARDALILALQDPKPGIRAAAAASLGSIGGDEAIAALRDAMNVKNPILSGIIRNAIEKAEGKK